MRFTRLAIAAAAATVVLTFAGASRGVDVPITEDTYLDSTYSVQGGLVVANTQNVNFDTFTGPSGSSSTPSNLRQKVVSSNGSQQFPGNSKVRGLFRLPAAFWAAYDTGNVTSAAVKYKIANNSLNAAGLTPRDVELHPLTRAFGLTTATWRLADATTPWSTTDTSADHDDPGFGGGGGDFNAANFVNTDNPNVATGGYVSWTLNSFFTNPTAMQQLRDYGALIKVSDETNFEANRFYSLYSYNAGGTNVPLVSYTVVPEPGTAIAVLAPVSMWAARRRSRRATESRGMHA